MKKSLAVLLAAAILLCTGCLPGMRSELTAAEDEIVIAVDISGVEDPVYRVDMSCFLGGDLMSGAAVSAADGTEFEGPAVFRLTPEEFPENASLEGFSFRIVLCFDTQGLYELFTDSENVLASNECAAFTPEYGGVYWFTVTGSFGSGLALSPKEP